MHVNRTVQIYYKNNRKNESRNSSKKEQKFSLLLLSFLLAQNFTTSACPEGSNCFSSTILTSFQELFSIGNFRFLLLAPVFQAEKPYIAILTRLLYTTTAQAIASQLPKQGLQVWEGIRTSFVRRVCCGSSRLAGASVYALRDQKSLVFGQLPCVSQQSIIFYSLFSVFWFFTK